MKTNFITCKFEGRLGNIVLEIYSTFLFAKQNNIDFNNVKFNLQYSQGIGTLDPNTLEKHPIKDYIDYCKDILLNDFLLPHFIPNNEWKELFSNCSQQSYSNAMSSYLANPQSIVLKPYQWKKIESIEDLQMFRQIFNISDAVRQNIKEKYTEYFTDKPTYAVHIRRTDYKLFMHGKYLQTKENILKNMHHINDDNFTYVIFSDDIEWCKDNIIGTNIKYHDTKAATEDLLLMSNFDDIISGLNSTYAYVAKLLNTNIKSIPAWYI